MKPGDLVRYHKIDVWEPPHDIKNGTIGVIIKKRFDLEYEVLIEGKIRIITTSLLRVINEAQSG